MKELFLIICVSFLSTNAKSQNSIISYNTHKSNQYISANTNAPTAVFQVHHKSFKEIVNTTTKRLTAEYKAALEAVTLATLDSVKAAKDKQYSGIKKDALDEISMHVNNFLNSKEAFKDKRESLQYAQTISDKYKFGYVLFADATINRNFHSQYISLSNNKKDMKNYLKDIIDQIETDKSHIMFKDFEKLAEARAKLETLQQYEFVNNHKNVTHEMYTLGESIANPETEIGNYFETLGRYYVVNSEVKGLKTRQLISAKDIRLKKIDRKNLMFKHSAVLIKHSNTNKVYLVESGYINQFAVNKIPSPVSY